MSTLDEHLRRRLPRLGDWQATRLRRAAVLGAIVDRGNGDEVLFVVRPLHLRQHAGQVAFPGGMSDDGETPLATALRECHEEVGAPAAAIEPLGGLSPRESSSGILVHCVIARLQPIVLTPAADEVARTLHVPLIELRDDTRWHERQPPPTAAGRQPRVSPHFVCGDDVLWGLTALFVRDLIARL